MVVKIQIHCGLLSILLQSVLSSRLVILKSLGIMTIIVVLVDLINNNSLPLLGNMKS